MVTRNYSFDVEVSDHQSVKRGVLRRRVRCGQRDWHRVVVTAADVVEAHLIAAQMASNHGMCTAVYLRE